MVELLAGLLPVVAQAGLSWPRWAAGSASVTVHIVSGVQNSHGGKIFVKLILQRLRTSLMYLA